MDKMEVLSRYFGYREFRPGQEGLIDGVLAGRDVFGIMPTGGGKSMCYQIPALMLPGITVVISPLISLMQDQVLALKSAGIRAAYINSSLTYGQVQLVYRNLLAGLYKIVYVAPERLEYSGFGSVAQRLPIDFVAVDEAHCISQWGQDFRPSYLRIVNFIDSLPKRPVVGAFTATATRQVREDVERILHLENPVRTVTGFDRPNLYFEVMHPDSKEHQLLNLMAGRKRKSGIIYCSTRKNVEHICEVLRDNGFAATRYHAGLPEEERRQNQEDFLFDRQTVMVATNAFGMGIDKSNVSFVIHYNMPKCIESYYQEAGRAGRDGSEAECILLYNGQDIATARYFIDNGSDNEDLTPEQRELIRRQDLARLEAMIGYCKTDLCLRGYILEYFGQKHGEACGNCGSCRGRSREVDITLECQMVLSCIYRVRDKMGEWGDFKLIARVLQGSRDRRVLENGLQQLSTFGLMKSRGATEIRKYADQLELEGYLRTDPEANVPEPTENARLVLFEEQKITMLVRKEPEAVHHPAERAVSRLTPEEMDLFEVLQELRGLIAKRTRVPPDTVFTDATLSEMARSKPKNMSQFRKISGVGELKASWYGKEFVTVIKEYLAS